MKERNPRGYSKLKLFAHNGTEVQISFSKESGMFYAVYKGGVFTANTLREVENNLRSQIEVDTTAVWEPIIVIRVENMHYNDFAGVSTTCMFRSEDPNKPGVFSYRSWERTRFKLDENLDDVATEGRPGSATTLSKSGKVTILPFTRESWLSLRQIRQDYDEQKKVIADFFTRPDLETLLPGFTLEALLRLAKIR
jgi:hypothetical protein